MTDYIRLVNLAGSNSKTISSTNPTSTYSPTTITINKTGGAVVSMSSNITFVTTGQDLTINTGEFDVNGKTLTVVDKITLESGGTFRVNSGTYSPLHGTGNFIDNGGTFIP